MIRRKPSVPWRVYGGAAVPRDFPDERSARRFARKRERLGITSDLYSLGTDGQWQLRYSHLDGEHEVTEPQS